MELQPVSEVRIQVLMDNYCDIALPSSPAVRRPPLGRPGGDSSEQQLAHPLVAEHGLSYWIRFTTGERVHSLLLDFGFSPDGALRNARALDAGIATTEALVLSHGHFDHYGGLREIARHCRTGAGAPGRLPLYVGEGAFLRRYIHRRGKIGVDIGGLDRADLEGLGLEVREITGPTEIIPGALLLPHIPRLTPFETGSPALRVEAVQGREEDALPGELALVFRLPEAGLVLVSACAHAGIINTLRYAQAVTGEDGVAAVIGGFHLTGADTEVIAQTVSALAAASPGRVVPMHCTGFAAQGAIAALLGQAFVQNTVGTEYVITSE